MKSLIWKEFRLCWPILLVGAGLLMAPYVIRLTGSLFLENHEEVDWISLAAFSTAASILTLTLLGGYAIACERADRSAEFLAYQPIPRSMILASKLVWPIAAAVVIWSVNLCVLFVCHEPAGKPTEGVTVLLGVPAAIALVCFSVAWFVSSLQDSPTYAVGAGIMTPVAIGLCFSAVNWLTRDRLEQMLSDEGFVAAYIAVVLAVAMASFVGGCWYYLQRVEP